MRKYRFAKLGCYAGSAAQAAVICLTSMLLVHFHDAYGISYTLLGLLAVFNFCSQLGIDLIFSFFSRHFDLARTIRATPLLTIAGLGVYGFMPMLFPGQAYVWIVIGTILFSLGSGLTEVLLSPVIAAIPSEEPGKEMSRFHSVYAWGVVATVVIDTLFLRAFSLEAWHWLALLWMTLPAASAIFFRIGEMPPLEAGLSSGKEKKTRPRGLALFICCIFLGSCAENTMTQWCSSYVEKVLGFEKLFGDLIGVALFAVLLGMARTLYGIKGGNISKVLLVSFFGATAMYLVAGLSGNEWVGLAACIACGFFVSMLWPGTLVWTEQINPASSVVVYALLAAGGDLGGSIAPQLMGSLTDWIAASPFAENMAAPLQMTAEQVGLKGAMVLCALFPLLGIVLVTMMMKKLKTEV